MHMIKEQIKNKIKEAMLAKDQIALTTYRNVSSAFTNELVAMGRKPVDALTNEEALAVIKRMIKKAGKAIELFKQGNRMDLVEKEEKEVKIMEAYAKEQTNNS